MLKMLRKESHLKLSGSRKMMSQDYERLAPPLRVAQPHQLEGQLALLRQADDQRALPRNRGRSICAAVSRLWDAIAERGKDKEEKRMSTSPSQRSDDNPMRQEYYNFSYDSELTLKLHASRRAAIQAAFFLPYLQAEMKLLDCGCGSGSITVGLAQALARGAVTGIDLSEVEVGRARSRAATAGLSNLHFEVGNVYRLAFPNESFDAIFSHNLLEHVGEPRKALGEMFRLLKPGGVIGIRDFDLSGCLYAPPEIVESYARLHRAVWEKAGGHPDLGRELRGLLHEAGFVDVVASASYETYADAERLHFFSHLIVSRCEEADFVKEVVERGLVSYEQLEEIKDGARSFPSDPAAFAALAHGEVVGRKG